MYIVELVIFLMFLLLFFYFLFLCVLRRSTGNSLYLTYLVGLSISYFEYGLLGVPLGFQGSIRTKLYSVLQWLNILAQKLRRFYIILVFSNLWGFLLAYQHKTSRLNTTSPKQKNIYITWTKYKHRKDWPKRKRIKTWRSSQSIWVFTTSDEELLAGTKHYVFLFLFYCDSGSVYHHIFIHLAGCSTSFILSKGI